MDDSDWEYEYDPSETEDFYFTLDISTHDPTTTKGSERLAAARQPLSATAQQSQDPSSEYPNQQSTPAAVQQPFIPVAKLQILDLHTPQPFIKLDSDLYACEWIDDLGTQLFVVEPGTINAPIKPGTSVDIVGCSQTRLLAKPIRARYNPALKHVGKAHPREPIVIDDENDSEPQPGILHVPPGLVTNERTEKQASFLQRLSRVKADKQQSPIVFASEIRNYNPPANKNEVRQRALDAIASQKAAEDAKKDNEKRSKPRKRRRYTDDEDDAASSPANPPGSEENG